MSAAKSKAEYVVEWRQDGKWRRSEGREPNLYQAGRHALVLGPGKRRIIRIETVEKIVKEIK